MKKITLLLMLTFLMSFNVYAHVIFKEDFEGTFPPDGWTRYAYSLDGEWEMKLDGYEGFCAYHDDTNGDCNNWLVTPSIDLSNVTSEDEIYLTLYSKTKFTNYYNYSGIKVSTISANPPGGAYVEVHEEVPADDKWSPLQIDLHSYHGHSNVYIAFQYRGNFDHEWFIDTVRVEHIPVNVYISPETQKAIGRNGTIVPHNLTVENKTKITNSYALSYSSQWHVNAPSNTSTLAPNATYDFTLDVEIPYHVANRSSITTYITAVGSDDPAYTNHAVCITEATYEDLFWCENFDTQWLPPGWTHYQRGAAAGWQVDSPGADGTGSNAFHDDLAANCNDWLVSPAILLTDSYSIVALEFYNRIAWPDYYDASKVLISTNGADPSSASYFEILDVGNTDVDAWTRRTVDISSYIGSTVYIAFQYTGNNAHQWGVDDLCLRGTFYTPSGTLIGTVTAAHDAQPLYGAQVTATASNALYSMQTTTDASGMYSFLAPTNAYNLRVTMPNYHSETASDVTVFSATATTQNFSLTGSIVSYSPTSIYEEVLLGESVSRHVTLSNSGPDDVSLSLFVSGFNSPRNFAEMTLAAQTATALPPYLTTAQKTSTPAIPAYALRMFYQFSPVFKLHTQLVSFKTDTPGTLTESAILSLHGSFVSGGDFLNGDFSRLYTVQHDSYDFACVYTNNGEMAILGSAMPLSSNENWTGLSGAGNGKLYGSTYNSMTTNSYLYTLNPYNGAATFTGIEISNSLIIDIAVDTSGNIYGLELFRGELVRMSVYNDSVTVIGSVGFNANYQQSMDFDDEYSLLFLAAYNSDTSHAELRLVDTATGSSTNVGVIGAGDVFYPDYFDGVSFLTYCSNLWADNSLDSVVLPAGSATNFTVTLDSSLLTEHGLYTGYCYIHGNYANHLDPLPLFLNIPGTEITVTPTNLHIGDVEINTTTQATLSVQNTGVAELNYNAHITNYSSAHAWLSMSLHSGTLATGVTENITLTADVAGMTQGFYSCEILFNSNDPLAPQLYVPVSIRILPTAQGTFTGLVTSANSGAVLAGADVRFVGGTFDLRITTDSHGAYSLTLPTNVYSATASLSQYAPQTVTHISLLENDILGQNFSLTGSVVALSPTNISVTIPLNTAATNEISIACTGPLDVDLHTSFDNFVFFSNSHRVLAYAFDIIANNNTLYSFYLDSPENVTEIAYVGDSGFPSAADFMNGDFSQLYIFRSTSHSLTTINTTDGSETYIGEAMPWGPETWTGLSCFTRSNILYASSYDSTLKRSYLYTIDYTNALATGIGPIVDGAVVDIAVNADGHIYALELVSNRLLRVDATTGQGTPIGDVGFDAAYAQGMDFDEKNNVLYLASYDINDTGQLRTVNLSNGMSTVVGNINTGEGEWDGFAIASYAGIDWPYAVQPQITCPADDVAILNVVCDARKVRDHGKYTALMSLSGSFVNDIAPVILEMNVVAPEMYITPLSWDAGTVENNSTTQTTISVANVGNCLLSVNMHMANYVPNVSPWISLSHTALSVSNGISEFLTLTVLPQPDMEGSYSCALVFTGNDPYVPVTQIPITVEVVPEPFFSIFFVLILYTLCHRYVSRYN